jgi:hypothetical protein
MSTLRDLKRVLEVSVMRDDLSEFHEAWINQALREICQDVSFNCMRTSDTVTISSGTSSALLPANFKELTPSRPPIHLVGTDGALSPVDVTRREDIIKLRSVFRSPIATSQTGSTQVFIENNGESWTLNIIGDADSDTAFDVSYFRILPDLEDDDDSNYLTTTYEDLVESKLKAIAFAKVNDPLSTFWETKYEIAKRRASGDDARRWTRGRRLQMGG